MPDALSKTIPIWCAVINRYLFPEDFRCHALHTSPQAVSSSEHAQISSLLPSFVIALQALKIPASNLRQLISKPLQPVWITPESQIEELYCEFPDFHPIICCTVSRCDEGGKLSEGGYIQGAADDTENWAHGLTPVIFWAKKENIFSTSDAELPQLIKNLVTEQIKNSLPSDYHLRLIKPTTCVYVTWLPVVHANNSGANFCTIKLLSELTDSNISKTQMEIGIGQDKIGSRNMRKVLPSIIDFVENNFVCEMLASSFEIKDHRLIVACETGKNFSVGVALAILCLFFDDGGKPLDKRIHRKLLDKAFIMSRLSWISTSLPDVNPSRATLQSLNSFLINRPDQ